MSLRPEAWGTFIEDENPDAQRAKFVLGRLSEIATRSGDEIESLDIDAELEALAPDLIPAHVEILHHARRAKTNPGTAPVNENQPKVGRNDPCPCGSGKKFKKCCLN